MSDRTAPGGHGPAAQEKPTSPHAGARRTVEGYRKVPGRWIDDASHQVPLGQTCDECNPDNLQGVIIVGDQAWPLLEWKRLPHGTTSKYNNHGCRCASCRQAHRLAKAERRRRARLDEGSATPDQGRGEPR